LSYGGDGAKILPSAQMNARNRRAGTRPLYASNRTG